MRTLCNREKPLAAVGPACAVAIATTVVGCSFLPSRDGRTQDAAISAEVLARFQQYAVLQPPNQLRVQTLDRVVYLSGDVNTGLTRDLADSVARQVPGVVRVVDSVSTGYEGK
jgi:osmotically-inducible protein OsmY